MYFCNFLGHTECVCYFWTEYKYEYNYKYWCKSTNSLGENVFSKTESTSYYNSIVHINGDVDLAEYTNPSTNPFGAYYGGGGSGTAQYPYII